MLFFVSGCKGTTIFWNLQIFLLFFLKKHAFFIFLPQKLAYSKEKP